MDFITLISAVLIGVVVYKIVQIIYAIIEYKMLKDIAEKALEQAVNEAVIRVNIEKHQDTYYLFNESTGEFIAQGKDMQELKDRCDQRFPKNMVVANEEQLLQSGLKKN